MYYFDVEKKLNSYISSANHFDDRCNKDSIVGKGTYGVCFKLNEDEAIKITCDLSEVCTSIGISKGNYSSYPKILEIAKIENTELWIIRQDLCNALSHKDYRELNKILGELKFHSDNFDSGTSEGLSELYYNGDLDHFESDDLIFELMEAVKDISKLPLLKDLDLHIDNVMRLNGKLVLIDQKDTLLNNKRIFLQNKIINKYLVEKEHECSSEEMSP